MNAEQRDAFMKSVEIRILASVLARIAGRALEERFNSVNADISGLQYGILRTLSYHSFTLSELSRRFVLDPSTLVPVVDALERKGLISRGRDPNDRRRIPLSMTQEGASLIQNVPLMFDEDLLFQGLQSMGEEKTETLLSLLREIVAKMPEGAEMLESISSRLYAYQEGEANVHANEYCPVVKPSQSEPSTRRSRHRAVRSRMRHHFRKRDG